jgi:glycosyltransferase involved in cell wall biosynthesis
MPDRVIYVVRSWPRLSQTFIVDEVLALERRGRDLSVFSLVHSGETVVQPQVARVRAPVHHLDGRDPHRLRRQIRLHVSALRRAPRVYAATLATALRHPRLAAGYGDWSTLRCFHHATQVAEAVARLRGRGDRVEHLHAHFAHDPALVGLFAARIAGLRFSFTGHARDLLQIPPAALSARAAASTAVVTCCQANADYIAAAVPERSRPPVQVIHHGVDLTRFRPPEHRRAPAVPVLLSVGRLVEKKGFDDLLHALADLLRRGTPFECRIYGDGPLREELEGLRDRLGLHDRVRMMGARSGDEVLVALKDADVFVLMARQADDGDRDGIPNVLVEAMACEVPVVATAAGGIAELVRDGSNGLLRPERDRAGVAAALQSLLADEGLRRRLGESGRRTVEADFDVDVAARRLDGLFASGRHPLEVVR